MGEPSAMVQWLPVIGTLLGAIIGGGISFLAQWMATQRARETHMANLAEDRARWAAERQLAELKALYKDLENFIDATIEFRIYEAHKAYRIDGTDSALELDDEDKRNKFEVSLYKLSNNLLIFDADVHKRFKIALEPRHRWYLAKSKDEAVTHLMEMEQNLSEFSIFLAERYIKIFLDRKQGRDL